MHEFLRPESSAKMGSERSFGLVFSAVFLTVGLLPLIHGETPRWWCIAVAAGFLILALQWPTLLRPFNRAWFLFGLLLHKIVTPVVMGLIFYVSVVPIGLIRRLFVSDPFRLKFDKSVNSYWIRREPPGPAPESFIDQF
jgi:hypothetical protein